MRLPSLASCNSVSLTDSLTLYGQPGRLKSLAPLAVDRALFVSVANWSHEIGTAHHDERVSSQAESRASLRRSARKRVNLWAVHDTFHTLRSV